jgi:hypothetical protein
VIDDVLAFVHDAEARGLIARLVECVLVFPIDPGIGNDRIVGSLVPLWHTMPMPIGHRS